jgi:hypothetical protein
VIIAVVVYDQPIPIMKTTVGKVLSVATAVASVMFLGFVLVATLGGPNWVAEAQQIPGYSFVRTETAPVQWSATAHVGGGSISPNAAIEPVMVAVYDAKIKQAQDDAKKFADEEPALQAAITEAKTSIDTDLAALQRQVDDLAALLDKTESESLATAKQVEAKAEEVRKVELQVQSRREDVLRLAAQVEEIRTDRFRIHELQQQMQDLIQQIDGSLERAERRHEQLKSRQ